MFSYQKIYSVKSVRVHFAPGSNGRSFPLEYSEKFHLNCMVAAPGMLLNAGKKLEGACAARAVPARLTCHCYPPIKLASSKKRTAAA